jgi:chemotaxis protein MotA
LVAIAGIAVILVMVFGGYLLAGGKLGIILHALPFEMIIIGGAAVGAFVISNEGAAVKQTLRDLARVFRGPRWKAQDFQDLLCLLHELIRVGRANPMELEVHIERPGESPLWQRYPRILADHAAVDLVCDTLRNATMNYDDPTQVEEVLDKQIEAEKQHALHSSHALQSMADGLPALGIVAAVLGVIKTMGSIDQPPEVLGKLIGSALVGTFLGVFLAYGLIGPFAQKMRQATEADHQFYQLIREVLVANLHNHAPGICVEVGRQSTPHALRPSYNGLEEALRGARREAA